MWNERAIRSALSACIIESYVKNRGHFFKEVPIVLDTDIYNLKKTKEIRQLLMKLGFEDELERLKIRKIRAGKGKGRGRRYNSKKGPLFVLGKSSKLLSKVLSSIRGMDAVVVNNLNVELLAPGGVPGRLTLFTKDAIEAIKDKNLFTENFVNEEKKEEAKEIVKKPKTEKKKTVKTKK